MTAEDLENRKVRRATALVLHLVFGLWLPTAAEAEVHDYFGLPAAGEWFQYANYRIYWPDETEVVRAVYFYLQPLNSDSRWVATEPTWRALADAHDVAVMGAWLENLDMNSGVGASLLRALASFSLTSGHPEIEFLPLFFDGHSWGGQWGYHFAKWRPDRALGFVTIKGGVHDTGPAGALIQAPGYLFIGEFDLPYRLLNLTSIFEAHRPLGARWALALQPGAGHERVTDRELLDGYFLDALEQRLPLRPTPGQPISLLDIPENAGWLGDREVFTIAPFECFPGDRSLASWLPSVAAARRWQDFVSGGQGGPPPPECGLVFEDDFEDGALDVWNVGAP